MLRAERYDSIHAIDPVVWDSILGPGDVYQRHDFVRIVEDARISGSDFWYVLVWKGDELVGTACLSAFEIALDLLMEGEQRWIRTIRKMRPGFLRIRILLCGLPISLGQKNIKCRDAGIAAEVIGEVDGQMQEIAEERDIQHLCFKEFKAGDVPEVECLVQRDYFQADSLPYMEMEVRWNSFAEYLGQMRHPYRRKVKKGLRKLGTTDNFIDFNAPDSPFVLTVPSFDSHKEFYQHYRALMERTDVKLETLNQRFFAAFFSHYPFDLLQIQCGGQTLASAILIREGSTLHFMLIGLPEFKNEAFDPYFNLYYGIVQYAIQQGCTQINLGQTAYWVKQQIGGQAREVFLYYHCRKKWLHALLKRFKGSLFPKVTLAPAHVFKSSTPEPVAV